MEGMGENEGKMEKGGRGEEEKGCKPRTALLLLV